MTGQVPTGPDQGRPGMVVGVDGSPPSHAALAWALATGRRLGVPVLALQVSEDVFAAAEKGFCSRGQAEDWAASERVEGLRHLTDVVRELGHDGDADDVRLEVVPGQAAEVLLDRAAGAEMLVLGPRGRGRLRRLLGSVSQTCLEHAAGPVVIVPDDGPTATP